MPNVAGERDGKYLIAQVLDEWQDDKKNRKSIMPFIILSAIICPTI